MCAPARLFGPLRCPPTPPQIRVPQGIVAVETFQDHVALVQLPHGFKHVRSVLHCKRRGGTDIRKLMSVADKDTIVAEVVISEHTHIVPPRCRAGRHGMF